MSVLFIGKRFYTNRDALQEQYGRIWQLPWHWSQSGISTRLWLVDYHSLETVHTNKGTLEIVSTPVRTLSVFRRWLAERSRRSNKISFVIASGDCYIGLMGYRIARRLGAYFIFDVYDKYDEFGAYRRLPWFDPFSYLLNKAHARMFASRELMEHLNRRSESDALVPNGVDLSRFHPMDMQASRYKLGISATSAYIGYFGSMTSDRGVADLVEAVSILRQQGTLVELLLAGHDQHNVIPRVSWIRFLGNLSYDKVPDAMACCNVLALPYRHSMYLDMASSCKIAEYLAIGRPLVATSTPNFKTNFPLQASQLGQLLAIPGNPKDLARAIDEQLKQKLLVPLPDAFTWQSIAAQASEVAGISGGSPSAVH